MLKIEKVRILLWGGTVGERRNSMPVVGTVKGQRWDP